MSILFKEYNNCFIISYRNLIFNKNILFCVILCIFILIQQHLNINPHRKAEAHIIMVLTL
jgi:hypothetical protein